jgi:hypothetical protein
MKSPPKTSTGEKPQRRDRLIRERVHDPYKTRLKLLEPTVCPQCGAAWQSGRWQWVETRPDDANEELCQACHRINDKYPAGELTLSGKRSRTSYAIRRVPRKTNIRCTGSWPSKYGTTKRLSRQRISIFRAASGRQSTMPMKDSSTSSTTMKVISFASIGVAMIRTRH